MTSERCRFIVAGWQSNPKRAYCNQPIRQNAAGDGWEHEELLFVDERGVPRAWLGHPATPEEAGR